MKKNVVRALTLMLCLLMTFLTAPANIARAAGPALSVNTSITIQDLAQRLVGNGVAISNVTYKGDAKARGVFSGGTGIIGFEEGVILSTGKAEDVIGPNKDSGISTSFGTEGDADLSALMDGAETNDASILEFDFIPQSEVISFQYVLASDEYNEYLEYADVFGIFVNGKNEAWLPTTPPIPVSIGNVNLEKNSEYFINNDIETNSVSLNTEMDGLTVVLSMQAKVNKGVVNHIKLAIADYDDTALDSNIFIKAGSLSDNAAKPGILGFGKVDYSIDKNVVHASISVDRTEGTDSTVGAKWTSNNAKVTAAQGSISFNDGVAANKFEVTYPYGESADITLSAPIGGAKINPDLSTVHLYSPVYVTKVTSSKENGIYKADENIEIFVEFNGTVHKDAEVPANVINKATAYQAPELSLNSGSKAQFASGFDSNILRFVYTVNPNDFSKDLDYKDLVSLTGTLFDSSGNPVLLVLPAIGSPESISGVKDIVIDAVPPVITLNGDAKPVVEQGKPYTELGAKAIDGLDGDITSKITISGSVNTSVPGECTIKYSVTDKAGNTAEAVRTVIVKASLPQTGSATDTSSLVALGLLLSLLGIYIIKR